MAKTRNKTRGSVIGYTNQNGTPALDQTIKGDIRNPIKHDSAKQHVSGTALYIDDLPEPKNMLHLQFGVSEVASAKIVSMDVSAVKAAPGVVCVLTAEDIPGENNFGPVVHDDPVFATDTISYVGQSLFAVVATSRRAARKAAQLGKLVYEEMPALLTISSAKAAESVIEPAQVMARGNAQSGLASVQNIVSGQLEIGGQDHFYLEGQVALAIPGEAGQVHVHSSTQNPTEVQLLVANILGELANAVTVELRRMGGGFGGKETQPAQIAAAAALAAINTGRAVKCRLDRDDDMAMTGKRHAFEVDYTVGYDDEGVITASAFELDCRCGYSTDLSMAINDRAMFHTDNAYCLGETQIVSNRLKTNTVSDTAFRGFGGPQGMIAIEQALDAIAFARGEDPLETRLRNLYRDGRDITPYDQHVEERILRDIMTELAEKADYHARRKAISAFNSDNPFLKKGIALTPVKFGISFTTKHLNQAGALVHIYQDGSVFLNHGGTEMGQGLMIKVAQIAAHELCVDLDYIRISSTATDKVPNTSATAASSGSDLNGMAIRNACRKLKKRLVKFAAEHFDVSRDKIEFLPNAVKIEDVTLPFAKLVKLAYLGRVSLSATGFYRTPKIHYDRATHKGRPFYYYAYGAAISEVVIDVLTGENRVLRTDILHDVGSSLNPAIDKGQIEGGFIQGMGWLTTEELCFDEAGKLTTHAPSTYKIPACSDRPDIMNIEIFKPGKNPSKTIHRSKAVGEPPFMLAISVLSALSQAVTAARDDEFFIGLSAPATPERILTAIQAGR